MIKPTVLVISDASHIRENIAELLALSGYDTLIAANGKKGLEMAGKYNPDLVLCDTYTGGLDGFGVLRAIQNTSHMINVPFIFLSFNADTNEIRKGMNLGADDFLIKPGDEELLEVIETQLKKSKRIKQQFEKESKKISTQRDSTDNFEQVFASSAYKITKTIKARQSIYMEGDLVNFAFYLSKGKIKTFKTNDDGKEIITGLYTSGDIFGYASFFESFQKESATAIEKSELIYITRKEFIETIESGSDMGLKLIKSILHRFLETEDRMLKIAYNSSSKKVADALLYYCGRYKDGQDICPFDRRDIATIAGVANESVSRKLSYFSKKGWVKINTKTGHIKLQDSVKLEKLKS